MKKIHRIILLFVLIFVIGVYLFIRCINKSANAQQIHTGAIQIELQKHAY